MAYYSMFLKIIVVTLLICYQYDCKNIKRPKKVLREVPLQENNDYIASIPNAPDSLKDNDIAPTPSNDCWISLNASGLELEIANVQQSMLGEFMVPVFEEIPSLDLKMKTSIVEEGGKAERAIHERRGERADIPAGLNLGAHGMLRLTDAVLFFHRLKLRNDTNFRVDYLHNEEENFMVTMRLSLNDLRLFGSYERTRIRDPQNGETLFYTPTYGEVEFLLKNVRYKVEGRYRMLVTRPHIEHILSSLDVNDVFMQYGGQSNVSDQCRDPKTSVTLERHNIEDFLENVKTSLDEWLRDYFNDLMIFNKVEAPIDKSTILAYDKSQSIILNEWVDKALERLKDRMCELSLGSVRIPKFRIKTIDGSIALERGEIDGLDTIYRRSTATTKKGNKMRNVEAKIGFGRLRVKYNYVIEGYNGPQDRYEGAVILDADDMTAIISFALLDNPESTELRILSLLPTQPEILTMQGEGNRIIAKMRHLLDQQIIAIMINSLYHNIRLISTLVDCEPKLMPGYDVIYGRNCSNKSSRDPIAEGDFVLLRNDSMEFEIPAKSGSQKDKLLKVRHSERFVFNEMPADNNFKTNEANGNANNNANVDDSGVKYKLSQTLNADDDDDDDDEDDDNAADKDDDDG